MRIPNKVTALLSSAMILVTATNPAALLTATAANVNYGPIHVVPNTLEVEKSDTSFMKQYPTGQTLKFSAARNERESGQIIIHSDKNIEPITVDTAALFNGSSKIPKENIEVFFEQYEYVASNAYILQEMVGYHADALLPDKIAYDVQLNKMDSGNQGIWFTVTVPEDAQAGTYSGNFTVTLGEKTYTLPVQFTVYDFNLPEQTNYKNFYNDYTATNEKVYSEMAGYTDKKNYSDDLADFLNQRRLSTGYPKASFGWIHGNPEAQLDAYTQSVYDYVTTSASPYYNLEYHNTLGSYPPSARPLSNILFTFEFELSDDYSKYMDNREELDAAIKTKAEQLITEIETSLVIELSYAEKEAVLKAANSSLYYNVKSYTHTLTEDENKLISLDSKGTDYYLTSYDDEHKPSNIEWNERFYNALKLLDTSAALNVAHNFSLIAFPFEFELTNDYSQYKDNRDKLDAAIEAKAKDIFTVIQAASGIKLSSGEKRAVLDAANGFLYYNVKYNTHTLTEDEKKLISLTPNGTKYYQEDYDGNHEVQTLSNTEWIKRLYNALMLLGTSDALDVARYCYYKSHTRYCQYDMKYYHCDEKNNVDYLFGLQTILKALVKKSLETNTDLLQYAYFYSTQTDEPAPNDFWANYEVLATSCSFENSKKAAQKDINNYSGCSQKFKDQLTESLNNIVYFSTTSPGISITSTYTDSYYTSDSAPAYNCILTKGLKSLEELGINDYAIRFEVSCGEPIYIDFEASNRPVLTEKIMLNYSIDILSFRWITHSAAIRNVRVWKEASGDLNDDGILDKSDATMLEAFLVGNGHLTLELWEEADYDHNGVLNVIDLTLMKRAIL